MPDDGVQTTHHASDTLEDAESSEKVAQTIPDDFPEGGTRAWGVAISASCVVFCTLGYTNSFG